MQYYRTVDSLFIYLDEINSYPKNYYTFVHPA